MLLAICFCLIQRNQTPDGMLALLPYGPTVIYRMLPDASEAQRHLSVIFNYHSTPCEEAHRKISVQCFYTNFCSLKPEYQVLCMKLKHFSEKSKHY